MTCFLQECNDITSHYNAYQVWKNDNRLLPSRNGQVPRLTSPLPGGYYNKGIACRPWSLLNTVATQKEAYLYLVDEATSNDRLPSLCTSLCHEYHPECSYSTPKPIGGMDN